MSHTDANQNYNTIDFGLHVDGSNLYVYESGVGRGLLGTVTAGDLLRVSVEGGVVKYRKNGALLYTSTVAPTYPLLVDTALYSNGSTLSNVVIAGGTQNVAWTNAVGVTASGNSLTKTAATGWGNSGASSTQTIASGDGYVEFTASDTTTNRFCGLSNGDSNQNYTDVDYALHPEAGGTIYVYEGGVRRGTFGSYTAGDVMRVAVEGGVVKYRKNGALLYTSTVVPTYPLLVDMAFYENGATLSNVVMSNGSGGANAANINWLVTDQLGTPRMIFDQTGALANLKRHDYLPFGEEILAGTGGRTITQGYTGDSVRQKFTQKERDNETGLDYFGARYYASTQGRFTSTDPVIVTPERFYDPQQFNLYAYTRNNPLRFIDPTGETLTISGNLDEVKKQLADMLGTEDAAKRITFDEKTSTITVDLRGIDLSKNEGAALLSDVTTSNKLYDVSVGSSVTTLGGQLSLVPTRKGGDWQANLDNNPDDRFSKGKADIDKPKKGVDDQVAFNFDFHDKNSESTTKLKQAPNWTTTFHELAEAYAKVDGGMQYSQAHQKAIERETRLRDQRPYLKENNPGSGPGSNLIIRK